MENQKPKTGNGKPANLIAGFPFPVSDVRLFIALLVWILRVALLHDSPSPSGTASVM
jgi:hypothetical protein